MPLSERLQNARRRADMHAPASGERLAVLLSGAWLRVGDGQLLPSRGCCMMPGQALHTFELEEWCVLHSQCFGKCLCELGTVDGSEHFGNRDENVNMSNRWGAQRVSDETTASVTYLFL